MAPLESHAHRMDKFLGWLLAEQRKVERDDQLGGTYNQLSTQLASVRELEENLNANKCRLKSVNEDGVTYLYGAGVTDEFLKTHGTCLVRSCPAIDQNVTYLAAVNTTWKHLEVGDCLSVSWCKISVSLCDFTPAAARSNNMCLSFSPFSIELFSVCK